MKLHTLIAILLVLILMKNCAATEAHKAPNSQRLGISRHDAPAPPGVSLNFWEFLGTGGGTDAQETLNIDFPETEPCHTHPLAC